VRFRAEGLLRALELLGLAPDLLEPLQRIRLGQRQLDHPGGDPIAERALLFLRPNAHRRHHPEAEVLEP
jgi:hypothetical protein